MDVYEVIATFLNLSHYLHNLIRSITVFMLVVNSGGSGILAFILVLLLQGWYVLKIPLKRKHDSKKKVERP